MTSVSITHLDGKVENYEAIYMVLKDCGCFEAKRRLDDGSEMIEWYPQHSVQKVTSASTPKSDNGQHEHKRGVRYRDDSTSWSNR